MPPPDRPPAGPPPGRSVPAPATLPRRLLGVETLIVLSVSLLAMAGFANLRLSPPPPAPGFPIPRLRQAPLRGVPAFSVPQSTQLARQIFGTLFSLAPVWIV